MTIGMLEEIIKKTPDPKRKAWAKCFRSLYGVSFSRRWDAEQVLEIWYPMLNPLSVDQLSEVLDHLNFHREEVLPPTPREFRQLCKRFSRPAFAANESSNYRRRPMTLDEYNELADTRRKCGMRPHTPEERAAFLNDLPESEAG